MKTFEVKISKHLLAPYLKMILYSIKLQDTKSIYECQLHFYTLTTNYRKRNEVKFQKTALESTGYMEK